MKSVKTVALMGASSLCFAVALLAAGPAVSSEPNSSLVEMAQMQPPNQNITNANNVADPQNDQSNAQYQAQMQLYQQQLQQYRASRANYEERAARYEGARDRYIASHARYHRAAWSERYEHRLIVDTSDLLGADVHTSSGRSAGHVEELAMASGHVDALRVTLDHGQGDVWIESADLRFDADRKVVMTDLSGQDLREMAGESF